MPYIHLMLHCKFTLDRQMKVRSETAVQLSYAPVSFACCLNIQAKERPVDYRINNMKHTYLFLFFLLLSVGCTENRSSENRVTAADQVLATLPFDPYRSEFYQQVPIYPTYQQNKDTFLLGEELTARISLNEHVEMLKELASRENLAYKIDYEAEEASGSTPVHVMPAADGAYADVTFKVNGSDFPGQFQEQKWRYSIRFAFLNKGMNVYDTTFGSSASYVLKVE